jgi:raffinose synthase
MENILSRPSTCISRNSDDFMPDEEKGFREHMLQNAYNALYHDNVYVCDWDMYWTKHPDARKHALVRAISGGPVYVSDRLGETVAAEILPLIYHDGRLLRMDRSAKPAPDCIFHSPLKECALKLTNTVNNTGALAAFNITEACETVEADLSPSDIYDLDGEVFGAYRYFKRSFLILKKEEAIHVSLSEKGYELVLFIPLGEHVTPIGLTDKYMSAHAVKSVRSFDDRTIITLAEGGNFAFHKETAPGRISVNGTDVTNRAVREDGFYSIDLSDCLEEVIVTIELGEGEIK